MLKFINLDLFLLGKLISGHLERHVVGRFVIAPALFIAVSALETLGKNSFIFDFELLGDEVAAILDGVCLFPHHDLKGIHSFWLFRLHRFSFHPK
jgi:hypothetical protein